MRRLDEALQLGFIIALTLSAQLLCCGCIKWLGLHSSGQLTSADTGSRFCRIQLRSEVLNRRQAKFCRKSGHATVSAVIRAAQLTIASCESQFRNFRWNCQVLKSVPDLAPELRSLTAEQALVHALSGLALATTLSTECSRGLSPSCGCGSRPDWAVARKPEMQFKFEGCHANLRAGQRLARRFLSAGAGAFKRRRRRRPRQGRRRRRQRNRPNPAKKSSGVVQTYDQFAKMVNAFNYRVGIRAARHSEAVQCKCHGQSASCTVRTCHRILYRRNQQLLASAYIRRSDVDPLDLLLELYDRKLRRTVFDETGYQGYEEPCSEADRLPNPLRGQPACEAFKVVPGLPKENALLFHEHSLDYCSIREGRFPGTAGRECLPDGSPEAVQLIRSGSGERRREILCSVMCCGRTHATANYTYPGNHPECQHKTCRLLSNPFRVVCTDCHLKKSICN
ncbi:hypothetical protein BOX15_Mlig009018g1 [Macrostomum lignano]|uniref:Protein Wnt n=1 Tax=Macrostomum lignano TaxID=282301 RepID=A0A267DNV1_9PLAT|nr:hypothetical protein BOX15_Mlig018894g2 [Macrostomum lignano]PAA76758.1 hypothetical protein BOX15_Mlig009018g1 [Macrostomum lignano]